MSNLYIGTDGIRLDPEGHVTHSSRLLKETVFGVIGVLSLLGQASGVRAEVQFLHTYGSSLRCLSR